MLPSDVLHIGHSSGGELLMLAAAGMVLVVLYAVLNLRDLTRLGLRPIARRSRNRSRGGD